MSNFLLTDPSGEGLIAIGDIERRVAKDRLVGDGDIPYCKRTTLLRLKRIEISQKKTNFCETTGAGSHSFSENFTKVNAYSIVSQANDLE